jgi:hypothetical protein
MFFTSLINQSAMLLCLAVNYHWPDVTIAMENRTKGLILKACIEQGMAKNEVKSLVGASCAELPPIYSVGYSVGYGFYSGCTVVQRYDVYGVAVVFWNSKVQEVRLKPLWPFGDDFDDWIWNNCGLKN